MRIKRLFVALVLGLGVTLALAWLLNGSLFPSALAAGIGVNTTNDGLVDDGFCTLREAIICANTDDNSIEDDCTAGDGADVITLTVPGTYVLTETGTAEDGCEQGDLDITDTLTIVGLGPMSTTIDADGIDRVLDIRPGAGTVVISGVRIVGGHVAGNGGGIYNGDADLTLINTVVASNTADTYGGGMYVYQGSATLSEGQIVSNSADFWGGGVCVWDEDAAFTQTGGSLLYNDAGVYGGGVFVYSGTAALSGGQIVSNVATNRGGGVYVDRDTATFNQSGASIITHNTADRGGGVDLDDGHATLSGGEVVSNIADIYGGGMYINRGSVLLDGGQVVSNTAKDSGGGVYLSSSSAVLTQTNASAVAHNAALGTALPFDGGGGLFIHRGRVTSNGGQVFDNAAIANGGGVFLRESEAILVVDGGRIFSNRAGYYGGGMYIPDGGVELRGAQVVSNTAEGHGGVYNNGILTAVNTTISHNRATAGHGGGLGNGGTATLTYTTIASNTASDIGGGIFRTGGVIILANTIVAYNSSFNCAYANGGSFVSNGHNLEYDDTCGLTATTDITDTDPLLDPLTEVSGTLVHPLRDGSPAIDAGACMASVTTVDQRGVTRPEGAGCDIGAYERIWQKVYLPLVLRNYP